ncbi:MAG: hypothetical protein AAF722_21500 [Cyanobacteria bacterium P01_C01_bin.70]
MTHEVTIPVELRSLIDDRLWPRNADDSRHQNLEPLVNEARVRSFAPDAAAVRLNPPPFYTVSELIAFGEQAFW